MLKTDVPKKTIKLYGRKKYQDEILSLIKDNNEKKLKLLTIAGPSGIGKTSLVQSIRHFKDTTPYYFISGKFEKSTVGTVYSEFLKPFRNLVEQIFSENDEQINKLKKNLVKSLGENRKLLLNIIPELSPLLNDAPTTISSISPTEAKNQFSYIFKSFINIITLLEKPVILFLDDVQWINNESLGLLETTIEILKETDFFLILSFRCTQQSLDNSLFKNIDSIITGCQKKEINLRPLSIDDISIWLQDLAHQNFPNEIINVIFEKTDGNPFVIKSFFDDLIKKQIIPLKKALSTDDWKIELEKYKLILSDTAYVVKQFNSMSKEEKNIIEIVLITGKKQNISTISAISHLSESYTSHILKKLISAGLIEEDNNMYKISHDKISESIVEILSTKTINNMHYEIGIYLLSIHEKTPFREDADYFEMLRHLNIGIEYIDKKMLIKIITLNLLGAQKSRTLAAFNAALKFTQSAKNILHLIDEPIDFKLKFEVFKQHIEYSYIEKQYDDAEKSLAQIFSDCNNDQKATLLKLKLHKEFLSSDLPGALKIGLKALNLLGVRIPSKPNSILTSLHGHILYRKSQHLDIKYLENLISIPIDSRPYLIIKLLSEITPVVYNLGDSNLLQLLIFKQLSMILKHGKTDEVCYTLVLYGLTLVMRRKYHTGYTFGKLAIELAERPENLPYKSRVYFVFSMFVLPWNEPWENSAEYFKKAIKAGLQTGDFYYAACSCYPVNAWNASIDLNIAIQEANKYIEIAKQISVPGATERAILYQLYRYSLFSSNSKQKFLNRHKFDEDTFFSKATQGNVIHTSAGIYYLSKLKLAYFQNELDIAEEFIQIIKKSDSFFLGHIRDFEFCFFSFMCEIESIRSKKLYQKFIILRNLYNKYKLVKELAKNYSHNFLHHKILMKAEFMKLFNINSLAHILFQKAITTSSESSQLVYQAIIRERAGIFYLENNISDLANYCLESSKQIFKNLKFKVKARSMERRYSLPLTSSSIKVPEKSEYTTLKNNLYYYDPNYLLNFIASISNISDATKLTLKIIDSIAVISKCENIYLALQKIDDLQFLAARVNGKIELEPSINIHNEADDRISTKIINYAKHTNKIASWDDRTINHKFSNDLYIDSKKPKSIICIPVFLNKNNFIGLIYLESRKKYMDTSISKLTFLKILTVQSVVFLNNLLAEDQRKIAAIGKVASQVAHDLRSPLAALQVFADRMLPEIEERKRTLLRNVALQLKEIANNLEQDAIPEEESFIQICDILEMVVSERIVALKDKEIQIKYIPSFDHYGLFAYLPSSEFKRVVTNIINNGIEAITEKTGKIIIGLDNDDRNITISIVDTGAGIPQENLDRIFLKGFTTKTTGSGLGLHHANECLKKWGGSLDVKSELGFGTTISLIFPKAQVPTWYTEKIDISHDQEIICIDDDITMYHAWRERFSLINPILNLHYCANKNDLENILESIQNKNLLFFIDFEFHNETYTGIDLAKQILLHKNPSYIIYFVTSRHNERDIQEFALLNNIKIIPKFYTSQIPIAIDSLL